MSGETITNAGSDSLFGVKSSISEIRCEGCGSKIDPGMTVQGRICPVCGGTIVGIRIFRNALTGKILLAERVDL